MNRISIDLDRVASDIDRNIFGGYMEFGYQDDRFEYLDIGDSPTADKNALRSDVRNALERIKLTNIRFPGGNFASGYRWKDGIGPRKERLTRHDLAWNGKMENQYGTNEFIRLCRAMNIAPYLCANCGDGDMREAADWVEYCNGTGDTALVKLRQKHGFPEPHKVKYWGIGNEVDNLNQIGYKTGQEYARAYTEFSKVMKRVDPDIKLIASAVCRWESPPFAANSEWVERAQLMLEQAGDRIDYMAIHQYAHPQEDDPFENYMAFAMDFNYRMKAYEGLISAVSLERGIKHHIGIAVDEWGVWRLPVRLREVSPINITVDEWGNPHLPESGRNVRRFGDKMFINLEDALVTGLYLNAFIRHANSIRMANFTPMPTMIGINLKQPAALQPIFYPFELYSRTCGQLALDVFWKGDTFSGAYNGRAYSGIRTLDVAATLDKSRKQLVVYVVNQSKEESMESTISLTSGEFKGEMKISIINGPDIKAENTEDKPNQIVTRESVLKAIGKSLTYTFEPHSVTALVCDVN